MPRSRTSRVVVVAGDLSGRADAIAARLRRSGARAYATHSAGGYLRVATSVHPDVVLLDRSLPDRVERLLRAHPASAGARVLRL